MQPHIEEAWRSLRLADRDITAFNILKEQPEAHVSIVNFHAQQAVEKALKAVLYAFEIEFDRTHDLVKLGVLRYAVGQRHRSRVRRTTAQRLRTKLRR